MQNPFHLLDVFIALPIIAAIVMPDLALRMQKATPEQALRWRPRVRVIAIAALVLFAAGRFLFQALFPDIHSKL